MDVKTIYKICPTREWQVARKSKVFTGSAIDLEDGYIHFSTAAQVRQTARLHFAGRESLVLVAVYTNALGADLKWQASRGGDLFPHLFAHLEVASVISVTPLPVGEDGLHIFPELEE